MSRSLHLLANKEEFPGNSFSLLSDECMCVVFYTKGTDYSRKYDFHSLPSPQANSHEDIPEAVQQFVLTFDPPLVPALQVTGFDTQISIADDPPDYERANKVLKASYVWVWVWRIWELR